MSSENLHEPRDELGAEVIDRHRAIVSIMEELEAVDWYDQRAAAASDPELADVLAHNRDEEKEHAAMTLEWLRRRDPELDQHLRTYLFTEGDLLAIEEEAERDGGDDGSPDAGASTGATDGSLGLGSLRHLVHLPTSSSGGLL
jgi:ferritin-like protein